MPHPSHHAPGVQQPPAIGVAGMYRHHLPKGHRAPNAIIPMKDALCVLWGWFSFFFFCLLPDYTSYWLSSHMLTSCLCFQRGTDGLNTEDPVGVGLNLFSPFSVELSRFVCPPSRAQGVEAPWFANQGGERLLQQPQCSALHLWELLGDQVCDGEAALGNLLRSSKIRNAKR